MNNAKHSENKTNDRSGNDVKCKQENNENVNIKNNNRNTKNNKSDKEQKQLSGKKCRDLLHLRMSNAPRKVPAFTYQALQKNTEVMPPAKINVYKVRPQRTTFFKTYLRRGDIPVTSNGKVLRSKQTKEYPLKWFSPPQSLEYCYYLPIFFDGLADSDPDIRKLAQYGAMDMIQRAPHKVVPTLPKLILPLKRALNTRSKRIIISALKVIQLMVLVGPCVGQALVPYYRQILSICNLYKNINVNLGAGIDPDRNRRIGDVIEDTLATLEHCGGANSFINIKYMVPTYESHVFPRCDVRDATAKRPSTLNQAVY